MLFSRGVRAGSKAIPCVTARGDCLGKDVCLYAYIPYKLDKKCISSFRD